MNELVDALENFMDARQRYKKARDECEYDAEYYCRHEEFDMSICREKFENALTKVFSDLLHKVKNEEID